MRVTSRWAWAWAVVLLGACSGSHEPGGVDGGADASVDAAPDGRADAAADADAGSDGGGADGAVDGGAAGCSRPSDCTLAIRDCCGPCGRPSLDDFEAILVSEQEAHRMRVCPDPEPGCPACATIENPNLGATCDAATGACVGFDVERHQVSECTRNDECVVRVRDCCECGADTSPWNLVALHRERVREYVSMVCDPETACAACSAVYPEEVQAYCDAGRCRLRVLE